MLPVSMSFKRHEQGVALLIALLILVVVSLMGITAMKTSMFSAKIATGTQVDAMAFEGAESSVSDAFKKLENIYKKSKIKIKNKETREHLLFVLQKMHKYAFKTANLLWLTL